MAQDLQPASQNSLPAIDVREPSSMLLMPAWLQSQIAEVSDLGAGKVTVDPKTREIIGRVATIPASKMPNGAQRQAIKQRIADLEAISRPGPTKTMLAHLGELIGEYAPSRLDQETVSIKAEAYLDAVEDLPAWAVREAIRRWRRGEVSADAKDLDFAPKPPRLRRIAQGIASVAVGQSLRLQRILDAVPEKPLTDAEREGNQARYGEVLKLLAAPVVEHDDKAEREAGNRARAERLAASETQRKTEGAGR